MFCINGVIDGWWESGCNVYERKRAFFPTGLPASQQLAPYCVCQLHDCGSQFDKPPQFCKVPSVCWTLKITKKVSSKNSYTGGKLGLNYFHLQAMKKCFRQILKVGRSTIQKHLQLCSRNAFNHKSIILSSSETCSALASACCPGVRRRQTQYESPLHL